MTTMRPAQTADLPRLTEIYNHYVVHSPATFDLEPKTLDERREWFAQFAETGRYRLVVAEEAGAVIGYAGTTRWRAKPAYSETVETTVYCDPEAVGRGIGLRLYEALFDALRGEDVHRIVAGYVPPNEASARLHERCGFRVVGIFSEAGFKFGRYWDVCWLERAGPGG
ncbi:MAG TPA: GNAT family N-acetyltransferase [Acidobacteriaceae bacterium]|jgi:phosphinothricin acetyltransferase|nr:GNAT family N-acetyltransferase [Acidobacteriaceae bacterium]